MKEKIKKILKKIDNLQFNQFKRSVAICVLIIASITGCTRPKLVRKKIDLRQVALVQPSVPQTSLSKLGTGKKRQRPKITIWVHGTRLFRTITASLDGFFHASPEGLILLADLPKKYRLASLIQSLTEIDAKRFPAEHFYTFGWSGALSFEEREAAAKKLYSELKNLRKAYLKKYHVIPHFRLITHSHGGNVVLNLAKASDPADGIVVSQAILLASPVQKQTCAYVNDPIFEKVYALYSTLDNIQVLDPQGLYKMVDNGKRSLAFSERRFSVCPKLRQAKVKINGYGLAHVSFITNRFIRCLPTILDTLDRWEIEFPATSDQERLISIKK